MAFCDLCQRDGVDELSSEGADNGGRLAHWLECSACGKYGVEDVWREAMQTRRSIQQPLRRRVCAVVRRDTDRAGKCATPIAFETLPLLTARHEEPTSPLRQMERFVALAAERAGYFGGTSRFDNDAAMATRLYFDFDVFEPRRLDGDILAFMQAVEQCGYAKRAPFAKRTSFDCTLTPEGWRFAETIRRTPHEGDQAFVAMWFHSRMNDTFEHGIALALRATGYNPYRVDRAASQNKIDDDIIANIRKSRLVVADLTGVRPNVFYEAGFAHGLGVPLVLTCNSQWSGQYTRAEPDQATNAELITEGWFKQVETHALDIRNYPLLGWSDPEDLRKALYKRIHALALNLVPPRTEEEWK